MIIYDWIQIFNYKNKESNKLFQVEKVLGFHLIRINMAKYSNINRMFRYSLLVSPKESILDSEVNLNIKINVFY